MSTLFYLLATVQTPVIRISKSPWIRKGLILFSKLQIGSGQYAADCKLWDSAHHYSRSTSHLNIAEVSNILMISLGAAAKAVLAAAAAIYQISARQVARHFLSPKGLSNEMFPSTVAAEDEGDGICRGCKMSTVHGLGLARF